MDDLRYLIKQKLYFYADLTQNFEGSEWKDCKAEYPEYPDNRKPVHISNLDFEELSDETMLDLLEDVVTIWARI